MKKLLSVLMVSSALIVAAQPKKAPKMAPVFAEGYYVNAKGDTVKGEIQTNPDNPLDFYKQFFFKQAKGKAALIDPKKAKAYGFEGKHFVMANFDGDIYVERLAGGRLNFFEYRFDGKVNGAPAVESVYCMQDTRAEGGDAKLKEIRKISTTFYKNDLKPYMKDQKVIWSDLDKYNFDKQKVIAAINEFNKFYEVAPVTEE